MTIAKTCEAGNFFRDFEVKTHGCLFVPCPKCKSALCGHWPECPRCVWNERQQQRERLFTEYKRGCDDGSKIAFQIMAEIEAAGKNP